jgi:hypothetical protein
VAIIQISRVTHRKGLRDDLPQPLAGAELGWATDTRQLFIGNGSLSDGAPVVGNTEILTEFSDILGFTTAYTYQGESAGYIVQTGSTAGNPVTMSLQQRLDQVVSVKAFGARGDGVTDDTQAINRALYELYCREVNPAVRRILFFPAGVYVITDSLKIPPYASLAGEGRESSIVIFLVQPHSSGAAYAAGVLVEDNGIYYRSLNPVPVDTDIEDTVYWIEQQLPDYIARTADSLQQVAENIATNGAIAPTEIDISQMKLTTNQVMQGFLWDKAARSRMSRVTLSGPLAADDLLTAVDNTRAVDWNSSTSLICQSIVMDDCVFEGFTYGTQTDQQVQSCTVSNSVFDTLYQGAVMGDSVVINGGANGFRLLQNTFDNIYAQGIEFDGVSRNISAYNTFYNVGNHFNGVEFPASSIIKISAVNNVSVGDMFARGPAGSNTHPCIDLGNTGSVALGSNIRGVDFYQAAVVSTQYANALDLGLYQRTAGIQDVLSDDSSAPVPLAVLQGSQIQTAKIEYSISRASSVRRGTLTVIVPTDVGGTGFAYTDDYVENSNTGVELQAVNVGGNIQLQYLSSSSGVDGQIRYSISHLN